MVILQQPYHYERTGVRIIVLCPELSQMSNVKNSEANPSQDQLIQKYFRRYFQRSNNYLVLELGPKFGRILTESVLRIIKKIFGLY